MPIRKNLKVAIAAWEIGRLKTGLGTKVGGLGAVLDELPEELIRTASRMGIKLSIELLSPCFAHYDRSKLEAWGQVSVWLDGASFEFQVLRYQMAPGVTAVYFWDDWQLNWTDEVSIYPDDPEMAFKLFSVLPQAMAAYIRENRFDTVHGHDYHVALLPFYLGDDYLERIPFHLTIHNATYQGDFPVREHGYEMLHRINLPGERLFHRYFDFFDNLNFLKAGMLKTHEMGGKITTVSGDLKASWGYAAELRENAAGVYERARAMKGWRPVEEVFVPNRHLDAFERLPILGITNGMSERNRPENLPELKKDYLTGLQKRLPDRNILFRNATVKKEMLSRDHSFDLNSLERKSELKRLLHFEVFNEEPQDDLIFLTVVGRLVEQKNLQLAAELVEPVLKLDPGIKFAVLASAPQGDVAGKATEALFASLGRRYPDRVFFDSSFNNALSRLILAGGDFSLIPSRFEPCGLVDLEASLLGTLVIGHRIGGLAKVMDYAYLYDWLDIGDKNGELEAFFYQIRKAVFIYRTQPDQHRAMMVRAMSIDSSWDRSAATYVQMYEFGLLYKKWRKKRELVLESIDRYASRLMAKEPYFAEFFAPLEDDLLEQRLDRGLRRSDHF